MYVNAKCKEYTINQESQQSKNINKEMKFEVDLIENVYH
jgi:hypothetical protein